MMVEIKKKKKIKSPWLVFLEMVVMVVCILAGGYLIGMAMFDVHADPDCADMMGTAKAAYGSDAVSGPSSEQYLADMLEILSESEYGLIRKAYTDGMYAMKCTDSACYLKFLIKSTGDVPVFEYHYTSDRTWELFDWYWSVDQF